MEPSVLVEKLRAVATTHGNPADPERYDNPDSKCRLMLLAADDIDMLQAAAREALQRIKRTLQDGDVQWLGNAGLLLAEALGVSECDHLGCEREAIGFRDFGPPINSKLHLCDEHLGADNDDPNP